MSDGKIIYDVDVNDDGVEEKVHGTNSKIESAANTGSSAFSEVWTGALRTIGSKLVELGQTAIDSAVDVAKESLAQVASFEQNVGGIEKLFGDSAGRVMENANAAFRTAGLSANEYMETVTSFSASLISSLGGDTEKAAELSDVAMRSMSDNANTFGTDMESIMNAYQGFAKENYTMLDNLKLGYAGTKEGISKLIADASELTDVQEQLGLTVDGTSTDFANVVKAIEVMQTKMNIAGTTSREAAGTIEGSVNSLKAAWANFLTGTMDGESLAEIAFDAVNNIVNAFKTIIPRLTEGFATFIPLMLDFGIDIVSELMAGIGEKIPDLVTQGTEMIRSLGEGLATQIPVFLADALPKILSFTEGLRENAGKFVDAGIDMILNIAQGLADSLPTLIEYVPQIITNLANIINDNMPKILAAGVKIIITLVKGIIQAIPTLIANIPHIIEAIFSVIQAVDWLNLGKFIITGIKNGIVLLKEAIPELVKSIGEKGKTLLKNIDWRHLGSSIINFIVTGIQGLISSIPNLLRNIGSNAVSMFKSINWHDLGANIIRGIINGLASNASAVVNAARQVAENAFNAAKSFLGISSPSKAFAELGKFSDEGQAQGMIKNADLVEDASEEVAQRALAAQMNVDYDLPDIDSASRDMSASISGSFAQTVSRIIEVPLNIDAREIARATAWDMGEQLAWEAR